MEVATVSKHGERRRQRIRWSLVTIVSMLASVSALGGNTTVRGESGSPCALACGPGSFVDRGYDPQGRCCSDEETGCSGNTCWRF